MGLAAARLGGKAARIDCRGKRQRKAEDGQSKPKSYVATVEVEIEVEVRDGFIDIVTAPERSLKEARELKKNWPEGQQRTEQAVNSPHPLTAEAANPAADSPDARPAGGSVFPTDTTAQPTARADAATAQQQPRPAGWEKN